MKVEGCEDRIDIYGYDLDKLSLESLEGLLSIFSGCSDCNGCNAQVFMLEKLIAEREKK